MKRMVAAAVLVGLGLLCTGFAAQAASSSSGRMAEVEVVDVDSGRVLPTYRPRGRWYVAGDPGREYEIRIRNTGGSRVLAVTSVDGVNVVSGETATPSQSGYVLSGYDATTIEGWRKSLQRVARFYFTDLGDSYAARTDRPDNVGVIGVALFREREHRPQPWLWEERQQDAYGGAMPEAKSQSRAESSAAAPPRLGTGHGESTWSGASYTEFERASSRPDEIVTIHYDSHRNLQARGVIPKKERRWARSEPQPFPGHFAPDPWR